MQMRSMWEMGIRRRYTKRHRAEVRAWLEKKRELARLDAIANRPKDMTPKLIKGGDRG